ncbi:Calcium-binding protein 39-like [Balamuthia mandrillaris]
MSFFIKSKKEKPASLVKHSKAALASWQKNKDNSSKQGKAQGELSNALKGMKAVLYGDEKSEPNPEAINELAAEILSSDLIALLISNLAALAFEAKKDFVIIFGNLMRREEGGRKPFVEYMEKNTPLLDTLCIGYEDAEVALPSGQMLRQCLEHEPLAKHVLRSPNFIKFFTYVEYEGFDVASDAFMSFKDLLTVHKALCAEYLESNYDTIFEEYTHLLHSKSYVTKRQSLKLLGELLLDRANFNVMTKYISDEENLKLMMNLLIDKSKNIQFEAFHVFKVFVANPNKARPILEILVNNKHKLIAFLSNFHNDKDDEQFADEKAFLLKQIEQLPDSL